MRRISSSYSARETLPDGRCLYIRAIRPSDRKRLHEEFHKLSAASVRDRFFNVKQDLTPKELTFFTEVDFSMHVALVAELDIDSRRHPVGVGRFVRKQEDPDHSEFAITVSDAMAGQGIGKLLLKQLKTVAEATNRLCTATRGPASRCFRAAAKRAYDKATASHRPACQIENRRWNPDLYLRYLTFILRIGAFIGEPPAVIAATVFRLETRLAASPRKSRYSIL